MRLSRIQIAKQDILSHFEESQKRIFRRSDLDAILQGNRNFWRLAQRTTTNEFIDFLIKNGRLRGVEFPFPSRRNTRYTWGTVPFLEIATSLRRGAYISHFSAARAHGLSDQVPKTIYVNDEQNNSSDPDAVLRQSRIDAAFSRPQRVSSNVAEIGDYRICLLRGQNTNDLGVVTLEVPDVYTDLTASVRITNLERTLIDIAVRPAYSGGVHTVLTAYREAAGRASVNRIAALLKQLGYAYPYHQAIGFYIERCGRFSESAVDLIRQFPIKYDFYLTHNMKETEFVEEWRLYVPKGFYP